MTDFVAHLRRRRITLPMAIAAAVTAPACGDAPPADATTFADSAGVTIVTNLPGALAAVDEWSLSPEPVTQIGGGADPDVPLLQVSAVQPLEGGGVVVGMNAPARAAEFDGDGMLIREYGRAGEGPGEFSSVGSIVPIGTDSIAVWDPDWRRLSVFARSGPFARAVELETLVPTSPMAAPSTEVPAAFTTLLPVDEQTFIAFAVGVWGPGPEEAGAHRVAVPSVRIDARGREQMRYGPFPGLEMYTTPGLGWAPYPFARNTYGAVSGDRLWVGTADAPEIRVYGPAGALERIIRWEDRDRLLEGSPELAEFQSWLDEQLADREPAERELLHGIVDAMEPPVRLPAHGALVTDIDSGEIWVGAYPGQLGLLGLTPESRRLPPRRALVFQPDGRLNATLPLPAGFEPRVVRAGRIWGVYTDELDIESVRAYAIRRSRS